MSGNTGFLGDLVNRGPKSAPPAPQHEEEVREAMQREMQARTHPSMLVVRSRDGGETLLAYTLLRRAKRWPGSNRWELAFDDCKVLIQGRNLGDKLRDMLRLQTLKLLQEGDLIEGEIVPADKAFIESIEIQENETE